MSLRTATLVIANINYVCDYEKSINGVCDSFFGMLMHSHVAVRSSPATYNPVTDSLYPNVIIKMFVKINFKERYVVRLLRVYVSGCVF